MRHSTALLLAVASMAGLSLQAQAAVLKSATIKANHDLQPAYLLIGDTSGPASSVAAIKLSDYLVGQWPIVEQNTATFSLSKPKSNWNSDVFDGTLESLRQSPLSTISYTIMGVYSKPGRDVSLALPMNTASGLLGEKSWDDVFTTTEWEVGSALLTNNVAALQSFFVSAGQTVGFAPISEQAQLVKFCIASDGGTVNITAVPEPTSVGILGLAAAGLLRRRSGSKSVIAA